MLAQKPPSEGQTPLFKAAWFGRDDVVGLLIKSGALVSAANVDGETPLFKAAEQGHAAVVKRLLAAGADSLGANKVNVIVIFCSCKSLSDNMHTSYGMIP